MKNKVIQFIPIIIIMLLAPFYTQAQGIQITSGGSIAAIGAASIGINNGSLVNDGTYTKGSETLTFSGSVASTVSGSTNTEVNNLSVTNTGGLTTMLGLLTCNAITVALGSKLIVDAGKSLTVNGTTTLNAAEGLVIKSDASAMGSFIDNGISGSGTARVERWVKTNGDNRWEYISSPVSSASSSIFTTALRGLWYANEPSNAWVSISNALPQNMTVLKGYARKFVAAEGDGDVAKSFVGSLNSGTLSIALSGTTLSNVFNGWNLVGNPYPSTLDWNAPSGWTKTNIDNAIYFRTDGNFASYVSGVGTNGGTQYIPPMQSFWVRVSAGQTSGILGCGNNARVHSVQNIYKSIVNNTLHLTVANTTNGLTDDTYILFNPDATDGFDSQFDAYKMFAAVNTYPQFFTNIGSNNISINTFSELIGGRSIPLGFKTSLSGQYSLTADMVADFVDNGVMVYLEDLQTGTYQDLSVNPIYLFTSGVANGLNRFLLHFNPLFTDISEDSDKGIQIFAFESEIHINSTEMLDGVIDVYDMVGQNVLSKKMSAATSCVMKLNCPAAVYIVKYSTENKTITRKVVIR